MRTRQDIFAKEIEKDVETKFGTSGYSKYNKRMMKDELDGKNQDRFCCNEGKDICLLIKCWKISAAKLQKMCSWRKPYF